MTDLRFDSRYNVVDGCCMPCALLLVLLLLSLGHDLAAKKEKNRVRDENKNKKSVWLAAVGKLTEIVEVENETWQGAKVGVC